MLYKPTSLEQCVTDTDCEELGPLFADTVCEASLCVTPSSGSGGMSGGDGGAPSGGEGGEPPQVECTTNGDCIDTHFGSPYLCRDGECIPLTIPGECPIVLGAGQDNKNLRTTDPIVFGAYSVVDPAAPRLSVPTLNYELAIDEVNQGTRGGLPDGNTGSLRPFIAVICSATDDPDLDASMTHLTETLEVPAIISSLYTKDLVRSFVEYGLDSETFFLSPLEADSTLTNIKDSGLLWHLLTSARDLAPAYVPLLAQTETYLRAERAIPEQEPIRVALVESKTPFLTDIADQLLSDLRFNKKSAIANQTDGNFVRIRIDSSLETPNPDLSAALVALNQLKPHVVLSIASSEFMQLLLNLESGWLPEWGTPPFYLTSPYQFGLSGLAGTAFTNVHRRLLGVNFAGAEDSTLYDLYLSKLRSTYDVKFSLEGSENFYDAAYFLMYSIAGAGDPARLTGKEVALGMSRLLSGKTKYQVGSADVSDAVGTLVGTASSQIELIGTMGPPSFNTSTGARKGLPSVYCIEDNAYVQNVMLYEPSDASLTGSPSCILGFGE